MVEDPATDFFVIFLIILFIIIIIIAVIKNINYEEPTMKTPQNIVESHKINKYEIGSTDGEEFLSGIVAKGERIILNDIKKMFNIMKTINDPSIQKYIQSEWDYYISVLKNLKSGWMGERFDTLLKLSQKYCNMMFDISKNEINFINVTEQIYIYSKGKLIKFISDKYNPTSEIIVLIFKEEWNKDNGKIITINKVQKSGYFKYNDESIEYHEFEKNIIDIVKSLKIETSIALTSNKNSITIIENTNVHPISDKASFYTQTETFSVKSIHIPNPPLITTNSIPVKYYDFSKIMNLNNEMDKLDNEFKIWNDNIKKGGDKNAGNN